MKSILFPLCFAALLWSQKRKMVRNYQRLFLGYEKKDWNMVASQLADDFTFTSPIMMTTFHSQLTKRDAGGLPNSLKKLNSLKLLRKATVHSLPIISLQPITSSSATPSIILSQMAK
jgi:hypothetical protein